jgi:epoxyqueuosine reductase
MLEVLKSEIAKQGDRAAIVPVHRLQNIRQDVENLKGREELNPFQHYIVNDLYSLEIPESDFEIRSIIAVASPSPAAIEILFTWQGESIPLRLPASYVDKDRSSVRIEAHLKASLSPQGYHVLCAPHLPRKLIAVRSGLGRYGRNNISYVEGLGSFLNLNLYFSDIPSVEDPWQDIRQMDICRTCQACLHHCPTAAIIPTRFLIDNERCLTYFNEAGREWNFPEWIDPASHHTLYGCLRCQMACPVNKPYSNTVTAPVEFTEEETAFLLEGRPFELFPEGFKQKVKMFEMIEYLGALPRNLGVLLKIA